MGKIWGVAGMCKIHLENITRILEGILNRLISNYRGMQTLLVAKRKFQNLLI